MATTSSSDGGGEDLGRAAVAIQRSAGRSSKRPPSTMPPITATVLAAPNQPVPTGSALAATASSGSSARIGIAATSWNSRTRARPGRRWWASGCARPAPAARWRWTTAPGRARRPARAASRRRRPARRRRSAAPQPSTCTLPQPKIGRRSAHSRCGSSSRPTRNSISTTPNSAKCRMSCDVGDQPQPPRADGDAGGQVADDRAQARAAATAAPRSPPRPGRSGCWSARRCVFHQALSSAGRSRRPARRRPGSAPASASSGQSG